MFVDVMKNIRYFYHLNFVYDVYSKVIAECEDGGRGSREKVG